jgi:hypothetical protein
MSVDVSDPKTGRARLLSEKCSTCVFRPGNPMFLEPGRLADLIADACRAQSFIVCHSTLPGMTPGGFLPAICRGFADRYSTSALQILQRLDGLLEVAPPPAAVRRHRARRGHPEGTCVRCLKDRPIAGRGLCDACWAVCKKDETLTNYPYRRGGLPLADVVEEYLLLRSAGNTDAVIAQRLNMKPLSLQAALRKARNQGLLPQAVSR